ncbi:MAG: cyclase family protein [Candidatus Dormibacteria bacterium]
MKFIDLTQPLSPATPRSSDHPQVHFPVLRHYSTHGTMTREIHASLHSGTHVDAPSLYDPKGKNIDDLTLEMFCGSGLVVDFSKLGDWGAITADLLDEHASGVKEGDVFGLWTGWANYYTSDEERYVLKAPGLDRSGVDWVVKRKIKAIYSDTPSSEHVFMRSKQWRLLRPDIFDKAEIDPEKFPPAYAHKHMLPAGIMMVENLSEALGTLAGKRVNLLAFPAKYAGVEGAPARVAAVTEFP